MENHAFFGGVSLDRRGQLVDLAEVRCVEAGTVLFHGGRRYHGFYLLLEGAVHVYRLSDEGRMLVLHVIRPGESFAEVPLFEDREDPTYPATAETLDDSTLLFFPAEAFRNFVEAHPRSALQMLGKMAQRLREAVHQLDAVSLQGVQERLARHLVRQVPTVPDDPETPPTLELDIPKSVLAAELGTVPETLSRALRSLEEKELIRSEASTIALTDMRGLRRLGHEG
jgi:CRP/FNR family transcriptional regulator